MSAQTETAFVRARAVSKRYGAVQALGGVDFEVRRGEVHGLCGHNGAGKSTLVKVFVGLTRPDAGDIEIEGESVSLRSPQQAQARGIALVDQELSLVPLLSVEDNLFLGGIDSPFFSRRRALRRKARALLDRVGLEHVALGEPVEDLAIGERQLVEIARCVGREAALLILDEPTASLSESEIERVFRAVREVTAQGRSVIYVSHRLGEVLSLCDRVTIFRDGQRVGTHHVAGLDRRSLIQLMLGEMEGAAAAPPSASVMPREHTGTRLVVEGLHVTGQVETFSLRASSHEIIGLAGQLGSGTSTVLRALGGLAPDARGDVYVDGQPVALATPQRALRSGLVYVPNDRQGEGLFLDQSVEENLVATRLRRLSTLGILLRRRVARAARALAALVQIERRRLRSPVSALSGGNQQKVLIGRCLESEQTRVLLLDDPTRGVDVGGRAEIHRLIRHASAQGTTVLIASSELDEIIELSDVILTMFAGVVVASHEAASATPADIFAAMTMSGRRQEEATTRA